MPNMVPYTFTFEIVTIFFFSLPGNFLFFSLCKRKFPLLILQEGYMAEWEVEGLLVFPVWFPKA